MKPFVKREIDPQPLRALFVLGFVEVAVFPEVNEVVEEIGDPDDDEEQEEGYGNEGLDCSFVESARWRICYCCEDGEGDGGAEGGYAG